MVKRFFIILLGLCISFWADAQIITKRNYDYIGHEVNNAGLRVVGIKNERRPDGYYYDEQKHMMKEPILYGCIDKYGNEVVPLSFKTVILNKDIDYIYLTSPEYSYSWKEVGAYDKSVSQMEWLCSEDGKVTVPPGDYERLSPNPIIYKRFKCTIGQLDNEKYGIANIDKSKSVSPVYDELRWINYEKGYLLANLSGYWGIIDYLGREIVPYQWNEIKKLDDEYLAVELNSLWGIFDNNGNEIIPIQFNKIEECRDNIAIVMSNDEYGAYDLKNRQQIIPFGKYYSISDFNGKTFWGGTIQSHAYLMRLYSLDGTALNDLSSIYNKCSYIGSSSKIRVESRDDVKEVCIWDERYRGEDEHWRHFYYDDLGREYSDFKLAKAANDEIRKADNVNIDSPELASIIWLSSTEPVQDKDFNLLVSAQSQTDIQEVYMVVNGHTYRDFNINKVSGREMTISKEIPLNEGSNAIKVCVRNAAGTTPEERMVVCRPQGNGLPSIEWLEFAPTADNRELQIKLGIKSITKIENVTINGGQPRGIDMVQTDEYDMIINRKLPLKKGENRIFVSVRNASGISTSENVMYVNTGTVDNDKRIALVIGNSHYMGNVNSLSNPGNDAADVTSKLESLGFDVMVLYDATKRQMNDSISSFIDKAKNYDVALFYYAGHGLQLQTNLGGYNYLIPVDAELKYKSDAEYNCLNANQIVSQMESSGCKMRLVMLDACRDLPNLLDKTRGSNVKGFAEIKSAVGTFIMYSTREGESASDGVDRNSPFAEGVLKYMDEPNLPIETFFKKVGDWVDQKTDNSQSPWSTGRIKGDFFFNPK